MTIECIYGDPNDSMMMNGVPKSTKEWGLCVLEEKMSSIQTLEFSCSSA